MKHPWSPNHRPPLTSLFSRFLTLLLQLFSVSLIKWKKVRFSPSWIGKKKNAKNTRQREATASRQKVRKQQLLSLDHTKAFFSLVPGHTLWSDYRKYLLGQVIRISLKIEQNCCLFLDIFSGAIMINLTMTLTSRLKMDAKCANQQRNWTRVVNYFGTPPADGVHRHLCFEPGTWIWTMGFRHLSAYCEKTI